MENFALECVDGGVTPKGDALLHLARDATDPTKQVEVLVTGSRQKEEADESLPPTASTCNAGSRQNWRMLSRSISFSMLRREFREVHRSVAF